MNDDIDTIKNRLRSLRYEMRLVRGDPSLPVANRALRLGGLIDEIAELDRLSTKANGRDRSNSV
jgi:hypothetical protein